MATLANSTASRKPAKAFYAILDETHGALTKLDGTIYFFDAVAGTITEIEPEHTPFLTVLGEIGLADTQKIMDEIHGGAAWIATHRAMEVA
jgi:hypothetical protein